MLADLIAALIAAAVAVVAPPVVPAPCATMAAPAWCADLPPELVQQQLPEETQGRAYD